MKKVQLVDVSSSFNIKEGESLFVCPVCKFEYTHFLNRVEITNPETYLADHRGGGITIPMYCEEGHHWDLIISHHKGQSYIATDNFKEEIHE